MNERNFKIRDATVADIPIILQLIRDLATYERAPNDVVATEKGLHEVLFGAEPAAKVVIAFENTEPVGFAVYFFNFSTWLGRPGLYLEDLFVKARDARSRLRPRLAGASGKDRARSQLRANGMGGPNLERAGDSIL